MLIQTPCDTNRTTKLSIHAISVAEMKGQSLGAASAYRGMHVGHWGVKSSGQCNLSVVEKAASVCRISTNCYFPSRVSVAS